MDDLRSQLTIGRFARVAGLSAKALRIYERMGILLPASVDSETGYRYYSLSQLETAETVRLLRELEVPLAQIGVLVAGEDQTAIRELLVHHRAILEERLGHLSGIVDRLDGRLGSGRAPLEHDVEIRDEAPKAVISLRRRVATGGHDDTLLNEAEWACEAELTASLETDGLAPAGRPITLHHNVLQWYEYYDIEVCVPVASAAEPLGDGVWELPGGPCATTVHRGPWEEISPAYAALLSWVARRPLVITGPARWLYLSDERDTDDPGEYVTQLSWPVRQRDEAPSG